MLKVLLVDDEPFILQGIKVIIDWEKEGFEIAATAENGLEALEYLKKKSGSYHSRYPDAWYDRSGITGADTKGRNIGCVFCYSERLCGV